MAIPRTYGQRFDWRSHFPPAIKTIILACTGVFLFQTILHLFAPSAEMLFVEWAGLVPRAVTHGLRLWQPFTYLFLHANLMHLLINMFVFWMFGKDLERAWGTRRFYQYYFLCGIGAGLINVLVKTIMDPHGLGTAATVTIGASGAIFGVLLAVAMVFPNTQVWLIPFPIHIPMRIYVLVMGAIEFFMTIGSTGDSVSHVSHLGGMLVGYLFLRRGSYSLRFRNSFSDWKRRRLRRRFEVYERRHRDEPPRPPDNWVN